MSALPAHLNASSAPIPTRSAVSDVAFVTGGYLLVYFCMRLFDLPRSGSAAVLAAVVLASWRLRMSGEGWRTLGLIKPQSLGRMLLAVAALYAIVVASTLLIVEPLAKAFEWETLNISAYASMRGNPIELATILLIAWTTAAVGEELLFRGFLLTRLERMLGNRQVSRGLAIAMQAAIFGVAHAYLGVKGVATAAAVGAVYGAWYVLRGRNLWPLIIAHGLTDTVSLIAIYAGVLG